MADRLALYRTIGVGCKQLGIDTATMRDMFKTVTRKESRTDMDEFELLRVITHLRSNGFTELAKPAKQAGKMTQAEYMVVLWAKLYKRRLVQANTSAALDAWVQSQTALINGGIGIASRKMTPKMLARSLIERLKQWLDRAEKSSETVPDQRAKRVTTLA